MEWKLIFYEFQTRYKQHRSLAQMLKGVKNPGLGPAGSSRTWFQCKHKLSQEHKWIIYHLLQKWIQFLQNMGYGRPSSLGDDHVQAGTAPTRLYHANSINHSLPLVVGASMQRTTGAMPEGLQEGINLYAQKPRRKNFNYAQAWRLGAMVKTSSRSGGWKYPFFGGASFFP